MAPQGPKQTNSFHGKNRKRKRVLQDPFGRIRYGTVSVSFCFFRSQPMVVCWSDSILIASKPFAWSFGVSRRHRRYTFPIRLQKQEAGQVSIRVPFAAIRVHWPALHRCPSKDTNSLYNPILFLHGSYQTPRRLSKNILKNMTSTQ